MVSLDFTTVLFTLSFIVFLSLMKLCFFDPIARVINEREGFINQNLRETQSLQDRIQEEIQTKNPKALLTKARHEAQQIVSDSLTMANIDKQKILDDNRIKLQGALTTSLEGLNKESDKIRSNIDALITEIVSASIDKLLEEIQDPRSREALRS